MARRKPVVVRFASCELERGNSFIYRDVGVAVATVYFVGNSLRGIAVASRRSPGTELAMICFQGRESNRAVQTCRFSFLKLPRGFCGVSFRHLIRQRSNYYSPLTAQGWILRARIPNTRSEDCYAKPRGIFQRARMRPRATFVKVGRGWAGWHFAARNCAWHRGRNSFLPSLEAQPCCELPGQHPLLTSPGTYLSPSRTGLISYGCLVELFVSPQGGGMGGGGKRSQRRGERKLERWGSAGGGISRRGRCRSSSIRKGSAMHTSQIRFV